MGRERLSSAEEMFAFGKEFALSLAPNAILTLSGNLGSGKTTFVQGLAAGLQIEEPVASPTFVYLNIYQGTLPLFHFDLYRLKTKEDFFALGFQEYLSAGGICAIEWPEKIDFPPGARHLCFTHESRGRVVSWD